MRLVTFQPTSILKELFEQGYWRCDPEYVDIQRYGSVYDWISENMEKQIKKPLEARYPVWCWVKFKNGICPPRHKGKPIPEFNIKITFHKQPEEVFVTDYRRYSFLLNYRYIPENLCDKRRFEEKMARAGLEKDAPYASCQGHSEICSEIEASFRRCITSDSDVLQGCVWQVDLSNIERIDFLRDNGYQYGTFNYVRKNGMRFDWIEDFYKKLE